MKEAYYDDLLNIKTIGDQLWFNKSLHYNRYEPTPYQALEVLFEHYKLKQSDRVVDFGCGKGRLNFFIHYHFKATVVGIEMNELYYKESIENRANYFMKRKKDQNDINFYCCLAQDYEIHSLDNRFYFFNPFSLQVFITTINNIMKSVEMFKREVEIVLYYSTEDYIYYLENQTPFELKYEIIIPELYQHNQNERFLIYQLNY